MWKPCTCTAVYTTYIVMSQISLKSIFVLWIINIIVLGNGRHHETEKPLIRFYENEYPARHYYEDNNNPNLELRHDVVDINSQGKSEYSNNSSTIIVAPVNNKKSTHFLDKLLFFKKTDKNQGAKIHHNDDKNNNGINITSITTMSPNRAHKSPSWWWHRSSKDNKKQNNSKESGNSVERQLPTNISAVANHDYLQSIPIIGHLSHGLIDNIQNHVHLIKPGTKWCGDGNRARSYQDVGVFYKTDTCCRDHDKCDMFIQSHESKYGLYNDAHWTRSHCDCDNSFFNCLKSVNTPFSSTVGVTYFNVLKMKCFKMEYPVVTCVHNSTSWFSTHCTQYVVDMSKEKKWQWFDNYEY